MSEDLFKSVPEEKAPEGTPDQGEPVSSYVEQLVGEGKKFKDNEDLARGKVESDKHISNLEKEMSGLREDLNSRLNMQSFLDRLENTGGVTEPGATPASTEGNAEDRGTATADAANLSMKDVEALVSQKLKETTVESQRNANTQSVISKLETTFGSTYGDKVLEATNELGVGKEFMMDLAASNPGAFLKLVGADKTPTAPADPSTYTIPRTQVTTSNIPTSGVKRDSYYRDLRKNDAKRFWSPKVQSEMHREAIKQGESFFD